MTQLPDMASRHTCGLGAALRAIGFVLFFSFILFCIGLNQSQGLSCADDAWFAIIAKSARLTGAVGVLLFNTHGVRGKV